MKSSSLRMFGIVTAALLLVAAGFWLARMWGGTQPAIIEIAPPPEPTAAVLPSPMPEATTGPIHVYVSGAVANSAVYELSPGSIIDDAVRAAGGFAADADAAAVNLAQPALDGMQVHVPTLGEALPTPLPVSLPPAAESTTAAARMSGITVSGLININTATQAELEMLPGIGPSTAANIIAHREANGPFASIEAIMEVSGIGEGRFEGMRELITVGP